MRVNNSNIIISAASKKQWPETIQPEIVMVGRSNVGKSSIINALCHRKNLAYVGKTPGKTVLLNFYQLDDFMILVDAPGYGYAKGEKHRSIDFGQMMEDYFSLRENCKGVLAILDIRREPSTDDLQMLEYLDQHQIPYLTVFNKADKLSNNGIATQIAKIKKQWKFSELGYLVVSAEKKKGIDELGNIIEQMIGNS